MVRTIERIEGLGMLGSWSLSQGSQGRPHWRTKTWKEMCKNSRYRLVYDFNTQVESHPALGDHDVITALFWPLLPPPPSMPRVHPASPPSSLLLSSKPTYQKSSLFIVSLTKYFFTLIQLNGLLPQSLPCAFTHSQQKVRCSCTCPPALLMAYPELPLSTRVTAAFVSWRDCGMQGLGASLSQLPGSSILRLEFVEEKN